MTGSEYAMQVGDGWGPTWTRLRVRLDLTSPGWGMAGKVWVTGGHKDMSGDVVVLTNARVLVDGEWAMNAGELVVHLDHVKAMEVMR